MNDPKTKPPRRDWLLTVRQTAPRLKKVLSHLRPTYHLEDVRRIDDEFLRRHAIRGIIWDVDGTLTNYHAMEIAPELRSHVEELFGRHGLRNAILSNCDERRFDELKQVFPALPLIRGYQSTDGTVYRTARNGQDTHTRNEVDALLAAGARQIRKPSGALIEHATKVMDVDPGECVMVGDQYFTDVASANLAGIRSIKVRTFGKKTFPRSIQTTQRMEPIVYRLLYGKPTS